VALEFGNVRRFCEADEFSRTPFSAGSTHLAIEQHAFRRHQDPDGKLTIWSSTQTPHYLHRALAKVLEMPAAHIRVIATPNGGGFAAKATPLIMRLSWPSRFPARPARQIWPDERRSFFIVIAAAIRS